MQNGNGKIATGILGAGYIANVHAEVLKAMGIHISTVVDADGEKAEAFAKSHGIERWGTDPQMVLSDEIGTVHLCTPPNLHYEMVKTLLSHKKNVLCEKPLCFENKEAEELAELAKTSGMVCAVNFNVRFHMACQKAREIVASKEFGRVNLVHGVYLQEFHAFPTPMGWRYDEKLSGKMRAVTEIGTHWLDIAEYISGRKITKVAADFGKFYPERYLDEGMMYPDSDNGRMKEKIMVYSEDAAVVNLKFDNGAIGAVVLSEVSQGRVNRLSLEVTGEKENLWWNSEDNNMLHTASKGRGVNTEVFGFGNGFMDTFRELMNCFYQDVWQRGCSENPVYPTFEEGKNIVKLCNAMYESAGSNGRWVTV